MNYKALAKQAIKGKKLSFDEAMQLLKTSDDDTFEFLSAANHIKRAFKGNKVKLCAIVNAKSGKCTENCSFCAQSAHHKANSDIYPLMSDKKIFSAAKKSEEEMMATCFSIVTSGKSIIKKDELATIGTDSTSNSLKVKASSSLCSKDSPNPNIPPEQISNPAFLASFIVSNLSL